jgi:hypothetical protein
MMLSHVRTTVNRLILGPTLVALHCGLSGFEPDARDLDEWLAAGWPMVTEDMRPERWAMAYMVAVGLVREGPDEHVSDFASCPPSASSG